MTTGLTLPQASARLRSRRGQPLLISLLLLTVLLVATAVTVSAAAPAANPATDPVNAWLNQSRKLASSETVLSGETFTYTIQLVNSGNQDLIVWVADPVPAPVTYVTGTASHGGEFHADSAVLTWEVTVPAGAAVPLTFQVTAGAVTTPTQVVNLAAISSVYQRFMRANQVTILPEGSTPPPPAPTPGPPGPPSNGDLAGSRKLASAETVRPGDLLTYTIQLVNSAETDITVAVADQVPMHVAYVPDSASAPGAYNADTRTLTWDDIVVPAGQTVNLTFQVTAGEAQVPLAVVNRALITANGQRFVRTVTTMLLPADAPTPPPPPRPNLLGSRKTASAHTLTGGEPLTYTIHLVNSGAGEALVTVVDTLPGQVSYVAGTASHSGAYDATARTLTWTDVTVPAGETVALTFQVDTAAVDRPTLVVNTATISAPGFSRDTKARVLLLPDTPPGDARPPRVNSVRIGDSDVLTDPAVTLHIRAADDRQVTTMKIQEWLLVSNPTPHWEVVATSDWMPFQQEQPWTLVNRSGTHYVGVWVSDDAGNLSFLSQSAMDYASLLLPGASVDAGDRVAYMVHYEAGAQVNATLTTLSGDADLYVWFPMAFGLPSVYSDQDGTAVDQVSFTAPTTGRYLFVVQGYQASTYTFAITPGGGTGPTALAAAASTPSGKPVPQVETILTASGLDPIAGAVTPRARHYLRLPLIAR